MNSEDWNQKPISYRTMHAGQFLLMRQLHVLYITFVNRMVVQCSGMNPCCDLERICDLVTDLHNVCSLGFLFDFTIYKFCLFTNCRDVAMLVRVIDECSDTF